MKYWLITVSAPYEGAQNHYIAIAESNPSDKEEFLDWLDGEALEDLWMDYSYLIEDDIRDRIENGADEEEAWDDARDDWDYETSTDIKEISEEEYLEEWRDNYEVVYSEVQDKEDD